MSDHLNQITAEARNRELQRQAELWRLGHPSNAPDQVRAAQVSSPLVIRTARAEDAAALARLAQLDGSRLPEQARLLVAEVEGEVLAALPLGGGEAFADPFRPTASLVQMLKLRAGQIRDCGSPRRGLRARLSRLLGSGSRRPATAPATPGDAPLLIPRD